LPVKLPCVHLARSQPEAIPPDFSHGPAVRRNAVGQVRG